MREGGYGASRAYAWSVGEEERLIFKGGRGWEGGQQNNVHER